MGKDIDIEVNINLKGNASVRLDRLKEKAKSLNKNIKSITFDSIVNSIQNVSSAFQTLTGNVIHVENLQAQLKVVDREGFQKINESVKTIAKTWGIAETTMLRGATILRRKLGDTAKDFNIDLKEATKFAVARAKSLEEVANLYVANKNSLNLPMHELFNAVNFHGIQINTMERFAGEMSELSKLVGVSSKEFLATISLLSDKGFHTTKALGGMKILYEQAQKQGLGVMETSATGRGITIQNILKNNEKQLGQIVKELGEKGHFEFAYKTLNKTWASIATIFKESFNIGLRETMLKIFGNTTFAFLATFTDFVGSKSPLLIAFAALTYTLKSATGSIKNLITQLKGSGKDSIWGASAFGGAIAGKRFKELFKFISSLSLKGWVGIAGIATIIMSLNKAFSKQKQVKIKLLEVQKLLNAEELKLKDVREKELYQDLHSVKQLKKNIDDLKKTENDLKNTISSSGMTNFSEGIDAIVNAINNLGKGLADFYTILGGTEFKSLTAFFEAFGDFLLNLSGAIIKGGVNVWEGFMKGLGFMEDEFKDLIGIKKNRSALIDQLFPKQSINKEDNAGKKIGLNKYQMEYLSIFALDINAKIPYQFKPYNSYNPMHADWATRIETTEDKKLKAKLKAKTKTAITGGRRQTIINVDITEMIGIKSNVMNNLEQGTKEITQKVQESLIRAINGAVDLSKA